MTTLALSDSRERLARAADRHRRPGPPRHAARRAARHDLARRLRSVADRLDA